MSPLNKKWKRTGKYRTSLLIGTIAVSLSGTSPAALAQGPGPCVITQSIITPDFPAKTAQDMYEHPDKYAYIPWCDVSQGVSLAPDVDSNRNGIIDSLEVKSTPKATPVMTAAPTPIPAAVPVATPTPTPTSTVSPTPSSSPVATKLNAKLASTSVNKDISIWPYVVIIVALLAFGITLDRLMRRKKKHK